MDRPVDEHRTPAASSLLDRLLYLSDGVFAIAITLLVLEIALPAISPHTYTSEERQLPGLLFGVWPQIATYALSFLIVGIFWMTHQRQFQYIVRANSVLTWLNILFLMGVAFLPIPSKILGEYGEHGAAVRFYALSLMAPGLFILLIWWYATYQHRLVAEDLDGVLIRHRLERSFDCSTGLSARNWPVVRQSSSG